jgi:uncharacterized protein
VNVGHYYDDGKGVRRNRSAALYWYQRAYRKRDATAAHAIGVLYRNEGRAERALSWFEKAARLGDDGANLEIAKYFLEIDKQLAQAISYLKRVLSSNQVSEAEQEEAARLLRKATKKLARFI